MTQADVDALTEGWPALPEGCAWRACPLTDDGFVLVIQPGAAIRLCVDPEGRPSATGRPLSLRLMSPGRDAHEA